MNPELPKSMLDALAREKAPVEHPSADVLVAFVERTLASDENRQVIDHLARCSECRETVFLASAAEESEVEQRELVAGGIPQVKLQPDIKTAKSWTRRLAWAMPVAAVFLFAAGLVMWRQATHSAPEPELASKAASKGEERPAVTAPKLTTRQPVSEGVMQSPGPTPVPKGSLAKRAATPNASAEVSNLSVASAETAEVSVKNAAPSAKDQIGRIAVGGPIAPAVPAPAAQSASRALAAAPSKREGLAYAPSASNQLVLNRAAPNPRAEVGSHREWRVTSEGHLERLTANGWSRALASEAPTFRVVAVIGNDVWAGGTGGLLFHSSDGGQEWKAVSLSGGEVGTIVSIRFDNAQHGTVVTEDGKQWSTSDGGVTWAWH